jgi:hypothetical protein
MQTWAAVLWDRWAYRRAGTSWRYSPMTWGPEISGSCHDVRLHFGEIQKPCPNSIYWRLERYTNHVFDESN